MKDRCFAMNLKNQCGALNIKACMGFDVCPFYKSRVRANRDREKAFAHLCELPHDQQMGISATYYGGAMPWRGEIE